MQFWCEQFYIFSATLITNTFASIVFACKQLHSRKTYFKTRKTIALNAYYFDRSVCVLKFIGSIYSRECNAYWPFRLLCKLIQADWQLVGIQRIHSIQTYHTRTHMPIRLRHKPFVTKPLTKKKRWLPLALASVLLIAICWYFRDEPTLYSIPFSYTFTLENLLSHYRRVARTHTYTSTQNEFAVHFNDTAKSTVIEWLVGRSCHFRLHQYIRTTLCCVEFSVSVRVFATCYLAIAA